MDPGKRRWLNRGLIVIGLAFVVWIVSRYPLADIADACAGLGVWVMLTPLICMCWFAASAAALACLLDRRVPWRALMWNRVVGEGYNSLVPAAGFGGEPFKLRHITRFVDTRRALIALINDRMLDNGIGLGFSAICVAFGTVLFDIPSALRTTMEIYSIVAGLAAIAVGVMIFTNVTDRIGGRVARWIGSKDLAQTRLAKRLLLRAVVWFVLARCLGVLETALLFALLGLPVDLGTVTFTTGAIAAAGFIGFAIPQGIGVTDGAAVGIFDLLHFSGPAGIAFALARRGRMLVVAAFGILIHVAFGHRVALATDAHVGDVGGDAELAS